MKLDFSSFESAIAQLEKAYNFTLSNYAKDKDLLEQFRNSTIQCFEYTYELSWKFLTRQIESAHPNPEIVDSWDFKELIREGAVRGYIQNPSAWFEFRRLRNITSHAYDKSKAELVYAKANDLLIESKFLLNKIKEHNK